LWPGFFVAFFCDIHVAKAMNWQDLALGFALLLVFEGILPFLSPGSMKQAYQKLLEMDDRAIRWMGLISMLSGLSLLYFVR